MRRFENIYSVAAPLMRNNIDTDAIIPSREIKGVSKDGLGEGLFAGWRYVAPGSRDAVPDFVLNRPEFEKARILLAGENFGCGSSREHAVWALFEWGIRVVIAPSFGAIFYSNCIQNGLLPIVLEAEDVARLVYLSEENPKSTILIDLEKQTVVAPGKECIFEISPSHKEMLLTGQDQIDLTLKMRGQITASRLEDRKKRPWAYL